MKNYGKQRSTVKPDALEITASLVFVATEITPIKEDGTDDLPGFEGYEFDLMEYTKDEYIRLQAESNDQLNEQVTQTQLALCDVFEMLV